MIDYRAQDYTRTGKRYDFVLDCELHRSALECRHALEPHATLTVVGGSSLRLLQTVLVGHECERPTACTV